MPRSFFCGVHCAYFVLAHNFLCYAALLYTDGDGTITTKELGYVRLGLDNAGLRQGWCVSLQQSPHVYTAAGCQALPAILYLSCT